MERKLATIRRIKEIKPIEGKDKIVLAFVDGWQVIVQKDEFKEGDLCIYCEIDSVLPKLPPFEFLEKRDYRIKTIKMGGVLSQGICFPLTLFDSLGIRCPKGWSEGEDVTDVLGITKWERPDAEDVTEKAPKNLKTKLLKKILWYIKGLKKRDTSFPSWINKTDETRIQNTPWYLEDDEPWVLTEKVDGCSATFAVRKVKKFFSYKYEFYVCSRNKRLPEDDGSVYWEVFKKNCLDHVLLRLLDEASGKVDWVYLQGEIIAPKVQGNKYKVTKPEVYFFNLVYPYGRLDSLSAKVRINMHELNWVPIVNPSASLPKTVDGMLKMAHGKSLISGINREGLVCRSANGLRSFKAVDPDFLIKYDE